MKSQQRKTPVKKPRQPKVSDQDDNTIVLGSGLGGAGQSSYTINTGAGVGGYGIDTITLDPLIYSSGTSITSPSTITWNQNYTTATNGSWGNTADTTVNIDSNGLTMKAGTDIVIDGRSLSKSIDAIEERLGILNPNPELEDRWEQLKVLRKQYIELEKDLLEKEKLMKILKEQ
jgi:hypothetical protein